MSKRINFALLVCISIISCPARDCIPSIDQPVFVSAAEVDYLNDDDLVMTLTHNGITRAYPTRILDHHEIVNAHSLRSVLTERRATSSTP